LVKLGHVSIFLQDYPDAEPWAYLEKLICNWRIAEDKVRANCGLPAATPYARCQLFRGQEPTPEWLAEEAGQIFTVEVTENPLFNATSPSPIGSIAAPNLLDTHAPSSTFGSASGTSAPVSPPVVLPSSQAPSTLAPVSPIPAVFITPSPVVAAVVSTVPQPVQCDAWDINFDRMCQSDDPCCGDVRSDTAYCLGIYDQLGSAAEAVCHNCCESPQSLGPAAPVLDDLPLQIQCSSLDNIAHRMCKTDSCCSDPRSESEYCRSQYHAFNDNELAQICHYCCSSPQIIGPASNGRNLRSGASHEKKEESRVLEGAKEFNVYGKKFLLSKENFVPIEEDEQTYFDRQYSEHQRRNQQTVHDVDYEDLDWAPYEWLFRVETEYYFRYEGTMVQPPCWEVIHWRPLKDPIRVHKRQIDELNRLMAWRLNPDTCARDTAGIVSADSSRIEAHREIQYMHDQHRFVFCECKDWPSKFKGDREWCHRWNEDTSYTRFYEHPYSFDKNAGWLP
jgi:Eukaryotic-type carbonic anhydrase